MTSQMLVNLLPAKMIGKWTHLPILSLEGLWQTTENLNQAFRPVKAEIQNVS